MGIKANQTEQPVDATVIAPDEVTLEEFCLRLSRTDKRVEMIGGFEASEKAAGHVKGTEAQYSARYSDFVNKPV